MFSFLNTLFLCIAQFIYLYNDKENNWQYLDENEIAKRFFWSLYLDGPA